MTTSLPRESLSWIWFMLCVPLWWRQREFLFSISGREFRSFHLRDIIVSSVAHFKSVVNYIFHYFKWCFHNIFVCKLLVSTVISVSASDHFPVISLQLSLSFSELSLRCAFSFSTMFIILRRWLRKDKKWRLDYFFFNQSSEVVFIIHWWMCLSHNCCKVLIYNKHNFEYSFL